jgi:ribose/xylose/arabinose/galactoside ABC-type transport system permease subunit/ABC-type sugar transport system substrate-binding protein
VTVAAGDDRAGLGRHAMLGGLLLAEILVFSVIGKNFFSWENLDLNLRIGTELGLLALAMTPVIVTGGIDLSVGSMLGLCAVMFGKLWRDGGLDPWPAAGAAIGIGALAGGLNALLITRLRIPALIVTLGSYSLFRGIAEGITRGVDNFTNFPAKFVFLGQGYFGGWIPAQAPIFLAAAVGFWVLLHRSAIGRALSACGYSPEGARHAGIPVERRVALVYVLSGLASGVAAIIYVARFGQAKADAGTGYELSAITAVVLGGTSIFGGTGSIIGTLLGLAAIEILQNGLRLAILPPELAGILTGALLLLAIGAGRRRNRAKARVGAEESEMRNSQLAVLCAVILAAALIVVGGNFLLVRNLRPVGPGSPQGGSARTMTIAMMPKSKGNAYFIACHKGAEKAARELGVNLIWDGPTDPDPAKQNEIVETWITRGVDVIAVSCENKDGLSTVLRKAMGAGIKVVTFDADADSDARDFFVNQATPEGIGNILMDDAAKTMGGRGEFAIITSSLTAANQNEWLKYIEARRAAKYPNITMATLRPCEDMQNKAFDQTQSVLNAYPKVKLIMAICSPAVPGAAEAVKQSGRKDVHVIGLGLPNENKQYVHEGITTAVVLWNTMDLGYLTVYTAAAVKNETLRAGDTSMEAGRLGKIEVRGDNVLLGVPFTFDKSNIDRFDF